MADLSQLARQLLPHILPYIKGGTTVVNNYYTTSGVGTVPIELSWVAPQSRNIFTSAPLAGGGDLSADRTLALQVDSSGGLETSGGTLRVKLQSPSYLTRNSNGLAVATHPIIALHTVTGAALDLVGATATNTLGMITPSASPGAISRVLKTDADGNLVIRAFWASLHVRTPVVGTDSGNLALSPATGITTLSDLRAETRLRTPLIDTASGDLTMNPATGITQATQVYLSTRLRVPLIDTASGDLALSPASGVTTLQTLLALTKVRTSLIDASGDLDIAPLGDLYLTPGGSEVILPVTAAVRSGNFATGFPMAGFRIGPTSLAGQSGLSIGLIDADEIHTTAFVADVTRVDEGERYQGKGRGILAEAFVTPDVDDTVSITFEDSPALTGQLFSDNDWLIFRVIDRSAGLSIDNIWGQVNGYFDNGDDTQSWTFTLRAGPSGRTVKKGNVGVNFGAEFQPYIFESAIDIAGAPYTQYGWWEGANPYEPSSRKTAAMVGRLNGVGLTGHVGLYAGNGTTNDKHYIQVSQIQARLQNISLDVFNGAVQTVKIEPGGRARFGSDINNDITTFLDINPATSTATFRGTIVVTGGSVPVGNVSGLGALATLSEVNLASQVTNKSLANLDGAANTKLGGIAAGATVGAAWGTNLSGIPARLATNAGSPPSAGLYLTAEYVGYWSGAAWNAYIRSNGTFGFTGDGTNYVSWDGSLLTVRGNIIANNGTFTGTVTATAGKIADFTISGNTLAAGPGAQITLYGGTARLANGTAGFSVALPEYTVYESLATIHASTFGGAPIGSIRPTRLGGNDTRWTFVGEILCGPIDATTGAFSSIAVSGNVTASGTVTLSGTTSLNHLVVSGSHPFALISHNHSGANITSGTVAAARIDAAIARVASPTFTGTVTAPVLNVTSGYQRGGEPAYVFVRLSVPVHLTDTSGFTWDGTGSRTTGGRVFDMSEVANGAVPTSARALAVFVSGAWASAANGNYCIVKANGVADSLATGNIRSQAANINSDGFMVVLTNTSGDIAVTVAGATMSNPVMRLIGYFI